MEAKGFLVNLQNKQLNLFIRKVTERHFVTVSVLTDFKDTAILT